MCRCQAIAATGSLISMNQISIASDAVSKAAKIDKLDEANMYKLYQPSLEGSASGCIALGRTNHIPLTMAIAACHNSS